MADILDLPIDITNITDCCPMGQDGSFHLQGKRSAQPLASAYCSPDTSNPINATPRIRLKDVVSPIGSDGRRGPAKGNSSVPGVSPTIYREQGNRMIAIKFSSLRAAIWRAAVSEAARRRPRTSLKPRTGRNGVENSRRWKRRKAN